MRAHALRGVLGYPLTDELVAPDGRGRFVHFERGSIYWSPQTGAREIYGKIRDTWAAQGWELGRLGYPTSGEYTPAPGQRRNNFQHGYIVWDARTGATRIVRYRPADRRQAGRQVGRHEAIRSRLPSESGPDPFRSGTDRAES